MSNNDSKKRRVDSGIPAGGESGDGGIKDDVRDIKSMMQELINQNHIQTTTIQTMQKDITRLTQKCDKMERDNNRLEITVNRVEDTLEDSQRHVDEKLKYQDKLLQNQGWEYSAPYPSDDYWEDIEGINVVESFLKQIKQRTMEMRYDNNGDGHIKIDASILYHWELLPHWKEFTKALEQYGFFINQSVAKRDDSTLRLIDMDLPEEVIDLLSNALKSTHFQKISLSNNNFGQKGIDFALNYLKSNTILKTFTLINNTINNMDDINKLCRIIKQHSSIEILHLNGCRGEDIDGYEMLKTVMNAGKEKLKVMSLTNNSISTDGGTFISDFLSADPILETLSLKGNELDDNDAIGIAEALKQNTKLFFLRLTYNNITKTGWKALRKAEFDNTSLNAAADSNHTCNIKYPPDGDEIEGLDVSEMNGDKKHTKAFDPKYVRQKKIYSVLSSRNRDGSNVGHFEDVTVELLPDMLDSIQKYSNYRVEDEDISQVVRGHVHPLSIVYEICRNWEESIAVFEALSSCG